ncbi:hypothetical protein B566_EDAN001527 [Ephemera danica]|nr:hypothetical protein B566_EDAN001527 [Ephemera danica]
MDNFTSENSSSSAEEQQLFVGYSPVLLDFAVACCILFVLLGIPGNLITIVALLRCKKHVIYRVDQYKLLTQYCQSTGPEIIM